MLTSPVRWWWPSSWSWRATWTPFPSHFRHTSLLGLLLHQLQTHQRASSQSRAPAAHNQRRLLQDDWTKGLPPITTIPRLLHCCLILKSPTSYLLGSFFLFSLPLGLFLLLSLNGILSLHFGLSSSGLVIPDLQLLLRISLTQGRVIRN